ncbi:DNA helicase RecQ [Alteromonas ponticola]|uniref:DNA helicase RecQ n=1 Tax=Alteromonas aquimaris TaxID=2998417 RepID=A0ABT3PAQ9_9ALTE|nr:DNA helicase RecQ [Alteromonas aquimaris]MCW8109873.1 DNA helicase RecQ [Alteromonas aquimaris]
MNDTCTTTSLTTSSQSPAATILERVFGYATFRPGQQEVIDHLIEGKDVLVLLPTGGGKSLCYQVPALIREGTAIVVSPLISLMQDQVQQLKESGVKAAFLNSTLSSETQQSIIESLKAGHLDLLYVSPERMLQFSFLQTIKQLSLALFAIDEAHCVSHWGHDFRQDYRGLSTLKQQFPSTPIIALTATADTATQSDIVSQLALTSPYIFKGSFDRPNIRYRVMSKYKAFEQVSKYVKAAEGSGIIYCNSRAKVDDLYARLYRQGYKCAAYHAGMDADEREMVLQQFLRDKIDIVVATVAFGMGINKSNVRFVLHHDVPRSIESYYQETGRAGRDGLPADAMLLFNENDAARVRQWIEQGDNLTQTPIEVQKFEAMESFAEAQTCRRQILLNYFSQYSDQSCGNCDICLDPPKLIDGIVLAQKVLSCILRLEQQASNQYVIDILRGKALKRIQDAGHDQLTTYGIGKDKSDSYWHNIINQLIHQGLIRVDITAHAALRLTEAARPVLKGECELKLAAPRLEFKPEKEKKTLSVEYDKGLFKRFKHLRKTLADEHEVPPFVIFSDATLVDMANKLPTSPSEFLDVSGVGQTKLERYGSAFLQLINDYQNRGNDH